MTRAIIREWHAEEGWGVADALEAPGGIFIHFSFIEGEGYRSLEDGEVVDLRLEGRCPSIRMAVAGTAGACDASRSSGDIS